VRALFPFLCAAALLAAGCEDPGPEQTSSQGEGGGGASGVSYSGGGGGDVSVGAGTDRSTIADHYKIALERIRKQDWDGAREELVEALDRSQGQDIQKEIREHLKLVEQGLLTQPAYSVDEAYAGANGFVDKNISLRGRLIPGGEVGAINDYFFLKGGKKIKCRYGTLPLAEKKRIILVKEGAQVLVRGKFTAPWGNDPDPYLQLTYFRLEQLGSEQHAEQDGLRRTSR
jgi:hypothetical protein